MEVIAKTKGEFLIQATELEIKEIVNAVTGNKPKEILIGQKIPAIDYASTITKIKTLNSDYNYVELMRHAKRLNDSLLELDTIVTNASKIEI